MSGRASPLFGGGCLHKIFGCTHKILVVFGISVLILFSCSFIGHPYSLSKSAIPTIYKEYSKSLTPHDPISIIKDGDFEKLGFEGNGTKSNPYLIEDLSIHAKFDGIGISIVSTSAFFIIQNCEIYSFDEKTGTGIYLEKVVNGVVTDCFIHRLALGISVLKSEKCEFNTNTLSELGKGFYLTQSLWLTLESNYLTKSGYGVHLNKIDFSNVLANNLDDCNYGILIESSVEIETQSNHITGSFFGLYFHNTVRSKSINNMIQQSQYGVYFAYSQECNITSSELSMNRYGISLLEVDVGTIMTNLIESNSDYGIHIKNSRDVEILSNTLFDNKGIGIYIIGVARAEIHENEIGYNLGANAADFVGTSTKGLVNNWDSNAWSDYKGTVNYSISGDRGSHDNSPHYIVYLDSPPNINAEGPATGFINWSASAFKPSYYSITMNSIVVEEGFWDGSDISTAFSDLELGTYTFVLTVTTQSGKSKSDTVVMNVLDTTPPEWFQIPQDQAIECGSKLIYQLEASDYYGISGWWINNTDFSIDDGLLQNSSNLQYGVYHLEVRAYDPSGNYASHVITIAVTDSVIPFIDSPSDIVFIEGETGYVVKWNVFDSNPSSYELLRNGISIEVGEWTTDMTFIQYSLDALPAGNYVFTLIITDIAGNSVSNDIHVTVEVPFTTETPTTPGPTETETPTTTTSTESPTTDTEMTGPNMLTLSVVGIGAGVGLVIVIFVYKRR
jgi:parallel beta-helix repeat protein